MLPPRAYSEPLPPISPGPAQVAADRRPILLLAVAPGDVDRFTTSRFTRLTAQTTADAVRTIERSRPRVVGTTQKVLIDEPGVGRSAADAPDIDGVVKFKGGKAGEFAQVLIERADEHDLYGRKL